MPDSVSDQIAKEQASRRKRATASQLNDDQASLTVKSSSCDAQTYGGSSKRSDKYDTSIAAGNIDEDVDMDDKPVRLLDSCKCT